LSTFPIDKGKEANREGVRAHPVFFPGKIQTGKAYFFFPFFPREGGRSPCLWGSRAKPSGGSQIPKYRRFLKTGQDKTKKKKTRPNKAKFLHFCGTPDSVPRMTAKNPATRQGALGGDACRFGRRQILSQTEGSATVLGGRWRNIPASCVCVPKDQIAEPKKSNPEVRSGGCRQHR